MQVLCGVVVACGPMSRLGAGGQQVERSSVQGWAADEHAHTDFYGESCHERVAEWSE